MNTEADEIIAKHSLVWMNVCLFVQWVNQVINTYRLHISKPKWLYARSRGHTSALSSLGGYSCQEFYANILVTTISSVSAKCLMVLIIFCNNALSLTKITVFTNIENSYLIFKWNILNSKSVEIPFIARLLPKESDTDLFVRKSALALILLSCINTCNSNVQCLDTYKIGVRHGVSI